MFTVNVTPKSEGAQTPEQIEDEGVEWSMQFIITSENERMRCEFVAWDPNMLNLREWQDIANGVPGDYNFYQGNGEGLIVITDDAHIQFRAMPSGAGGDVSNMVDLPHSLVKPQLQAAVARAKELGWLRECVL